MSTHSQANLLQEWAWRDLSLEQQAIRHLLQHLLGVGKQVTELDKPGASWLRRLEELSKPQG